MDYYDPFFVDLYHYDPYYLPGASIYTYGCNDYWAYRRWQRWNAYNAWNPWNPYAGYGYGPSWSVSFGYGAYNPWHNPYVWNNYYYDPYWTWNGYNPYYDNSCGATNSYFYYNNNHYHNGGNGGNGNGYHPQTYVGPRRGGTTISNGGGYTRLTNGSGSDGRLTITDNKAPVIAMKPNPTSTRDVVDKQRAMANQQVDRGVTSSPRKPATTTAKDPAAIEGAGRSNNAKTEKTRPTREALPGDNVPANRTPTETRPSRQPAQQTSPPRSQETRPARSSGGSEAARPSRPSTEDRPVRSTETRPSRSSGSDSGESRSISPSSSGRSSGGDSGSSGGGSKSSSSGGGGKTSGGGSRGRN
jgi:hypothetical protein